MGKALWNLIVALVNATLILVALCLFLGLQLVKKVDSVTANLGQSFDVLAPLQADFAETRTDLGEIRTELAALRQNAGAATSAEFQAAAGRIDALETRIDGVLTQAETLVQDPGSLIDRAIRQGAEEAVGAITRIQGCTAPAETANLPGLPPAA